jgi:hypothetical protein
MDLALVEIDVLTARLSAEEAREVLGAFIADVEAALAEARAFLREGQKGLAAGVDPLAFLDLPSERRAGIGDAAVDEARRAPGAAGGDAARAGAGRGAHAPGAGPADRG